MSDRTEESAIGAHGSTVVELSSSECEGAQLGALPGTSHFRTVARRFKVTVLYDGTNPNHDFPIRWGRCQNLGDQLHGPGHKIIYVSIFDNEENDAAMKSYKKVIRVSLADLSCRPATVTVWVPQKSYASLDIP